MSREANIAKGSFIVIQDWMLDLDMTPSELLVFATIHGFCQDGVSTFHGSQTYLAKWGKCGRQAVNEIIKRLKAKNLVSVKDHYGMNAKMCEYLSIPSRQVFQEMAKQSHPTTDMCIESRQNKSSQATEVCRSARQNNIAGENLESLADSSSEKSTASEQLSLINNQLEALFGSAACFDRKFAGEIAQILQNRVGEDQIGEFLQYARDRALTRKPDSLRGLFRKLAVSEDVVGDFVDLHPVQPAEKMRTCPVCGAEIKASSYSCPHCNFSLHDAKAESAVREARAVYTMEPETRTRYESELEQAYGTVKLCDFRDVKGRKEREERILAVKRRFGVVTE